MGTNNTRIAKLFFKIGFTLFLVACGALIYGVINSSFNAVLNKYPIGTEVTLETKVEGFEALGIVTGHTLNYPIVDITIFLPKGVISDPADRSDETNGSGECIFSLPLRYPNRNTRSIKWTWCMKIEGTDTTVFIGKIINTVVT